MRTVIKGGTVITASDMYRADVLIEDEQIAAIGRDLAGDAVIDAGGAYVIPGGIDVHTHLEMPFGGTVSSDDFFTGHQAAAFGGTTTHLDFAIQPKGATLRETFDMWSAKAHGKAAIDYGFHLAITDLPDRIMNEIPQCPEWGVTSLKLFMAYKGALMVDDGTLFRALEQGAAHGLLTMVRTMAPREHRLARRAQVAYPVDLAERRDEPALTVVLIDDDRRRSWLPTLATAHGEQGHCPKFHPGTQQGGDDSVGQVNTEGDSIRFCHGSDPFFPQRGCCAASVGANSICIVW
jgi:dihydroorotase-like cyclic amidohydrolase